MLSKLKVHEQLKTTTTTICFAAVVTSSPNTHQRARAAPSVVATAAAKTRYLRATNAARQVYSYYIHIHTNLSRVVIIWTMPSIAQLHLSFAFALLEGSKTHKAEGGLY